MISKLKYHKDPIEFGEPYQLILPLNLEGLIPDNDSVRLLSHELEDLDYSLLYKAYSAKAEIRQLIPRPCSRFLPTLILKTFILREKLKLPVNETLCISRVFC